MNSSLRSVSLSLILSRGVTLDGNLDYIGWYKAGTPAGFTWKKIRGDGWLVGNLDSTGQFTGSWRKTGQFRTVQIQLEVNWIVQDSLQVTGEKLDSSGQFCIQLEVNWIVQDSLQEAGCQLDSTGQFTGSWRSTGQYRIVYRQLEVNYIFQTVYRQRKVNQRVKDSLKLPRDPLEST